MTRRPTVGLLGLTGAQTDAEIAQHHEGYLAQVGRRLATVADVVSGVPLGSGSELAAALTELGQVGVDAVALVTLSEQLPDGCAAALADAGAPLLLAGVQPERAVGADWSEYDLRFNHGISAVQELAGQCVSAGIEFATLTGDWIGERFITRFEHWARAAQTARALADDAGQPDVLERAATVLLDEHGRCSVCAMDWNRDALLVLPSPGSPATPGPLTTAAITRLQDGELRLVVGSGELLGAAGQQQIEQSHLLFAPEAGLEAFMEAWLQLGSPPEFVTAAGDRRERWRRLSELLEIEYEEI